MSVLVGKPAPDFTAPAVLPDGRVDDAFSLFQAIHGRYGLIFFYPLDFSDASRELLALDRHMPAFREREVVVVGVSIDSHLTHRAWRQTTVGEGGIGPVGYPLVADLNHDIACAYDVQSEGGMALRGAFLVDRDGTVRSQIINDLPLERNMDELLRLFDMLLFTAPDDGDART